MLIAIGFLIVVVSVFGGVLLAGGRLGPLFQPAEILMIAGAALGAFVASNNSQSMRTTVRAFKRLRPASGYGRALYMDLMGLLYELLTKARREGALAIESDIEDPSNSALFAAHPVASADRLITDFIADYLRLTATGSVGPVELDELMLHEIEVFELEYEVPVRSLHRTADAMPAFGIVAAVLGVVHALSWASAGPDQLGSMIAHALVGTFLGLFIGYGFIAPLGSRLERQGAEVVKVLQCIRVCLLANIHGYAPRIAVEFGRKALFSTERPTFLELEAHVRGQHVI
ncbi:flagellar motor stator protein MotA [Halioglobus japonicus]|uniref:Flagellar motor stator protein MotA n=1 Tax=Halioglobus japonicus TaxID=930805 RepID=A0AAP8MER2_9GAMM|nr:flagellar motor stator protein MotA [Halioglobus japonicus]PLW86104.1 flagellar motor stator protein MotA [Halioglobus japonicus]